MVGLLLIDLLFDFSFASLSLGGLDRFISGGMLVNFTGLEGENLSDLLFVGALETLVVNSSLILSQNNLELFSTSKLSHSSL